MGSFGPPSSLLHVHTEDRVLGRPENFTISLSTSKWGGRTFRKMALRQYSIPMHIWTINATQGRTLRMTSGVNDIIITIPEGNYTLTTLLAALNNVANKTTVAGAITPTFATSTLTGKVSIDWGFGAPATCTLSSGRLSFLLGFRSETSNLTFLFSPGSLHWGDALPNLQPVSTLYLCLEGVRSGHDASTVTHGLKTCIFPIPIDASFTEVQAGEVQNPFYVDYPTSEGNRLSFSLLDADGVQVANNRAEWSFTVELL